MVDHCAQVRHAFQHLEHVGQVRGTHQEVERKVVRCQQLEIVEHARLRYPGFIRQVVQHRAEAYECGLFAVFLKEAREFGVRHIEPADNAAN